MPKFNPATPITLIARFTKPDPANPDGPPIQGQIEGPASWSSNNPADVLTPSDDGLSCKVDASANSSGAKSIFQAVGDGNLNPRQKKDVTLQSDEVDWEDEEDIEATGGTIEMKLVAAAQ